MAGWQELHAKHRLVLEPSGQWMVGRTRQQMSRARLEDQNVRGPIVAASEEASIRRKPHGKTARRRESGWTGKNARGVCPRVGALPYPQLSVALRHILQIGRAWDRE